MWDRLSQREQIMLIILVFVLILTFYYMFLYQAIQTEIKELEAEKNQKKNQLAMALTLVKKLPELKERYNQLKIIEEKKQKYVSLTTEDFLRIIEEISQDSGAELISFIPREHEDSITLNIIIKGFYKNICDFLNGLKKLENQVEFNYLVIQSVKDELQLSLELFYKKREADGGDSS